MAKSKERAASIKETGEELPDDQWKRFEAAVDAAVKNGPKHRPAAQNEKKMPANRRSSKV